MIDNKLFIIYKVIRNPLKDNASIHFRQKCIYNSKALPPLNS